MLLKAIVEETNPKEAQGGRARRAQDAVFVIGAKKEKRLIEPYKYWRVDNKDKNKKRKTMAGKLWNGRKRPKLETLTPDEEVKPAVCMLFVNLFSSGVSK